ncbi:uncharacterized protein LOC113869165 isoform X2 [Abrus precatorius]|uniref:2-oxoadipate dioxygenase/decarboxylase n=1 Tax=Abrus precatorius TaxID=3816 RepID=A0A8B8LXP7_ABRPR|nr:uncharacterized protein LOC113869165 isoform X2 [Abrus precatorius]
MFATTKSSTFSPLFSFRRTFAPSKSKLLNFIPMKQSFSPTHLALGLSNPRRTLCASCSSPSQDASQKSSIQGGEAFLRGVLESMQSVYLNRNPTAKAILDLVHSVENDSLCYDHLAFRTFGEIIRKYTESSGDGNKYAALASSLGHLTWEKPLYSEFQQLASESEYAAWTLVNGYALNHVTISTHRLKTHLRDIKKLNQFIEDSGFRLNSEGGVLKVSPDGLLQQSSTVADSISFQFSDGITESVPCSYIEFAERLVLPQYKNLPDAEVKEFHRRDGFEVASADKIFESTSKEQLSRVGS